MNHLDVLTSSFMKFNLRQCSNDVCMSILHLWAIYKDKYFIFNEIIPFWFLVFIFIVRTKVNETSEILWRIGAYMQNEKAVAHIQIKIILFERKDDLKQFNKNTITQDHLFFCDGMLFSLFPLTIEISTKNIYRQ